MLSYQSSALLSSTCLNHLNLSYHKFQSHIGQHTLNVAKAALTLALDASQFFDFYQELVIFTIMGIAAHTPLAYPVKMGILQLLHIYF